MTTKLIGLVAASLAAAGALAQIPLATNEHSLAFWP